MIGKLASVWYKESIDAVQLCENGAEQHPEGVSVSEGASQGVIYPADWLLVSCGVLIEQFLLLAAPSQL